MGACMSADTIPTEHTFLVKGSEDDVVTVSLHQWVLCVLIFILFFIDASYLALVCVCSLELDALSLQPFNLSLMCVVRSLRRFCRTGLQAKGLTQPGWVHLSAASMQLC